MNTIELTWGVEVEERGGGTFKAPYEERVGIIYMNGYEVYRCDIYDLVSHHAEALIFQQFARDIAPEREIRLR